MRLEVLSDQLNEKIRGDERAEKSALLGFDDGAALRRESAQEKSGFWCNPFVRDVNKIMHSPYFNRYADKTQVFSLFKNDDMTRRSLHVQLVSRIARTIGRALRLNVDLIEAIALGHDVGHPAFAHTGEKLLDELYGKNTGRRFFHNIHSVRVLDKIHPYNLTLQTLDGIAAHNGEMELEEYHPVPLKDFTEFDERMARCAEDGQFAEKIMPSTLEGAVVRISDIIAYVGKDRQDAILAKAITEDEFEPSSIGRLDEEIVNNLIVTVIENSYGKPYIKLDSAHFATLKAAKKENYEKIYNRAAKHTGLDKVIKPMMENVYGQLLDDVKKGVKTSPVFTHHVANIEGLRGGGLPAYEKTEPNQLVVDYIASMTDDYFIELHEFLFKASPYVVRYRGYFEE